MALKDRYFTVAEAAKELGVTRQTISRWIKGGKIAADRVGRVALIEKKELHQFHRKRLSEAAADNIIALVYGKLEEYFREKGYLNADERLKGASKERAIIAAETDGTIRIVNVTEEEIEEAFNYCTEPLAEFLHNFNRAVARQFPALIKGEVTKKRRKTPKRQGGGVLE